MSTSTCRPVTWLVLSEIFPLRVRSAAVSIGTLANFGSNLLVALVFESEREVIGESALFGQFAGNQDWRSHKGLYLYISILLASYLMWSGALKIPNLLISHPAVALASHIAIILTFTLQPPYLQSLRLSPPLSPTRKCLRREG